MPLFCQMDLLFASLKKIACDKSLLMLPKLLFISVLYSSSIQSFSTLYHILSSPRALFSPVLSSALVTSHLSSFHLFLPTAYRERVHLPVSALKGIVRFARKATSISVLILCVSVHRHRGLPVVCSVSNDGMSVCKR